MTNLSAAIKKNLNGGKRKKFETKNFDWDGDDEDRNGIVSN